MGGGTTIKRTKEVLAIFIVFLLCFSFINNVISTNALAEETVQDPPEEPSGNLGLLGSFIKLLGGLNAMMRQPIQFFLMSPKASPAAIEIGYGESVSFDLGFADLETGEFMLEDKPDPLYNARYLNFEVLEYPSGNAQGTWTITYDPFTVNVVNGVTVKSNVTLSLRSPSILEDAVQNGVLKIRIHDTWANGHLWRYIKIIEGQDPVSVFFTKIFWLIGSLSPGGYGYYSGLTDTTIFDVNILVKIKPYHAASFESTPYIEFKPNTITSLPITIQNQGNYNDTYLFRITSKNKNIKISEPISLTLAPGEFKDTYLGISIPPNIFDFGTIHQVKIEAYSIDEPNETIAERTVIFETKGLHITEMGAVGFFFLLFIILLGAGLLIYRKRGLYKQYCEKPDKPWDVPEEKKYLEKLKEKDRKKYKEIFSSMEDEYLSALLWHKYYCESLLRAEQRKKLKAREEQIKKKKTEIEKLKKEKEKLKKEEKIEKKVEEKPIKKEEKAIKKEVKTEEKPVKNELDEIIIDEKAQAEKLEKERAFLRIRQEQEKQKKKFGK